MALLFIKVICIIFADIHLDQSVQSFTSLCEVGTQYQRVVYLKFRGLEYVCLNNSIPFDFAILIFTSIVPFNMSVRNSKWENSQNEYL